MQVIDIIKKTYHKLFWSWQPGSEKEAGDAIVKNFALHWFPNKVSKSSLSWNYSLWLGTISFVLFMILVFTGVVLMFLYVPSVERAYWSVKDIQYVVSFGWLMRNMHRISTHLMVFVVFLHMVRVFVTGGYKNGIAVGSNRPLNWIIGIVLLLLTWLLAFTGYLLPWDQLAFWAITVGINIAGEAPLIGNWIRELLLGGSTIDQSALIRFYVLHCFFLPLGLLILFAYHMWRVRKDGGLAVVDKELLKEKKENHEPIKTKTYSLLGLTNGTTVHVGATSIDEEKNSVPSVPHLTRRIWLVSLMTILMVVILSILFPAPLEAPANPNVTPNPAKAPWYFLWLQEIVTISTIKIGSFSINGALIGGILLPAILIIGTVFWPYLDKSSVDSVGVWFPKERKKQNMIFLLVVLLIVLFTIIGTYLRGPYWEFYWPWQSWPEPPVKF